MKRPEFSVLAMCGLVLLTSVACSSGSDGIDVTTSWLGPLHRYERLSGSDKVGVFVMKSDARPSHVEKIVVLPAEITVSAGSDLNVISPASYEQLRTLLTTALEREMEKRFPSSGATTGSADNRDTYTLRAALTNLTVKRKSREIGPVGLKDLEFSFEDAAIEFGLYERRSNARRGAAVHKAQGKSARWNALADRFREFAAQAAEKAAEARNGINSKAAQPSAPVPAPGKPPQKTPQKQSSPPRS